ncbi:MAG: hypothetical protein JXB39_00095 [Deltaproteobacteria bacterium]|nr:hypothetical protein [Deltaproteobacteria bacterium]
MNLEALVERILDAVDDEAYLVPAEQADPRQQAALDEIARAVADPSFDPPSVRRRIIRLHAEGRIDRIMMLSALHVVAAHPSVADWSEAARLAGEQEQAALDAGGPRLQAHLASVDRHRGVSAFLQRHYEVALEHFARAFEREHSAENLGNVLCTLLALGQAAEARELLGRVRATFPRTLVRSLEIRISRDPDLILLREEERYE